MTLHQLATMQHQRRLAVERCAGECRVPTVFSVAVMVRVGTPNNRLAAIRPPVAVRCVPLSRGLFAIVDDADFAEASRHKWCAERGGGSPPQTRSRPTIRLHSLILGEAPRGMKHRFRNGNALDCRRSNVQLLTHREHSQSRRMRSDNSSGFIGVQWCKSHKKWAAFATVGGRFKRLGRYDDKAEAARVRDAYVREHYGKHVTLNFPGEAEL
ncbi:hypothetical protein [Lacipirellula sp.]|uniref:hypothetical protein n=1 Tax=Lacipirellula sp. TaxID=2691419 RepID=UPI003D0C79F3